MKTMSDDPSEKDPRVTAWERYRDAARSENEWMIQRLGWLLTSQTILFGAYGLLLTTVQSNDEVAAQLAAFRWTIAIGGWVLAILGTVSTANAGRMHFKWTSELIRLVEESPDKRSLTFGNPPYWPARLTSIVPASVALVFVGGWVLVLQAQSPDSRYWSIGVPIVMAIAVLVWEEFFDRPRPHRYGVSLLAWLRRKRKSAPPQPETKDPDLS